MYAKNVVCKHSGDYMCKIVTDGNCRPHLRNLEKNESAMNAGNEDYAEWNVWDIQQFTYGRCNIIDKNSPVQLAGVGRKHESVIQHILHETNI